MKKIDDTSEFVLETIERSAPKMPATTNEIADLEHRNAACYVDAEVKARKLRQIAQQIKEGKKVIKSNIRDPHLKKLILKPA